MSTQEKKLYKEITVPANDRPTVEPAQRTYRGLSTANPDNTNFKLFDIALIKQDIIIIMRFDIIIEICNTFNIRIFRNNFNF